MKTFLRLTLILQIALASFSLARSTQYNATDSVVHLDERGELQGNLYNKHGRMVRRVRVEMQKRQNPSFDFANNKVRGVNIGGWLVAEPWITPSLFDNTRDSRVIDEYTLGRYRKDACSRLARHWASFITESDFQQIAAANLNFVRIPIGYWALDNKHTYYCQGNQLGYLKQAVVWARNAGLKVVIDLHGAVGSQNGFDNSGKKGKLNWFTQESYKTRTIAVIQSLAQTFANDYDTVASIELLNEPLTTAGPSNAVPFMLDFCNKGISAVRSPSGGNTPSDYAVMIHDGFQQLSFWNGRYPAPQYEQILLDTHIYSVFDQNLLYMSQPDRAQFYCNKKASIASSNQNLWTIVGEWTAAPTDCAKYLNGRGVGARYDGTFPGSQKIGTCKGMTGSGATFSDSYKAYLKNMFDTQRVVYEQGTGWIFWTWKTEQAGDWDYQQGLKYGYITTDLSSPGSSSC